MRARVWLCGVVGLVLLCPHAAGILNLNIGLHLNNQRELALADVYQGKNSQPAQRQFTSRDCACTDGSCTGCFVEGYSMVSRVFYAETNENRAISLRIPATFETRPLLHTDVSKIGLEVGFEGSTSNDETAVSVLPDTPYPIPIVFRCITRDSKDPQSGLFLVVMNLRAKDPAYGNDFQNVTWYFWKSCSPSLPTVSGLNVRFKSQSVVDDGVVQPLWVASSSSTGKDIGYDPSDKEVSFTVTYSGVSSLILNLLPPEFDETVLKSVTYKSNQFNPQGLTELRSGAPTSTLITKITCQPHPAREATPGEVVVGFTNIDREGESLQDVTFRFLVECPFHGHKITPLKVLGIVLLGFLSITFIAGIVYNVQFTNRRGVNAIPGVVAIRRTLKSELSKRSKRNKRYDQVPMDDDVPDNEPLVHEEFLATVTTSRDPAYGAI